MVLSSIDINQTAIGVKLVKFEPMNVDDFVSTFGRIVNSTEKEGYVVKYPDGYISWSPKKAFEEAYFPIENDSCLDEEDVINFLGTMDSKIIDDHTTFVKIDTRTGWTEYDLSPCVDPAKYVHEFGVDACMRRIKDRIIKHLAFVLKWAKNGLKVEEESCDCSTPCENCGCK